MLFHLRTLIQIYHLDRYFNYFISTFRVAIGNPQFRRTSQFSYSYYLEIIRTGQSKLFFLCKSILIWFSFDPLHSLPFVANIAAYIFMSHCIWVKCRIFFIYRFLACGSVLRNLFCFVFIWKRIEENPLKRTLHFE